MAIKVATLRFVRRIDWNLLYWMADDLFALFLLGVFGVFVILALALVSC
jgi:hypothetical protein